MFILPVLSWAETLFLSQEQFFTTLKVNLGCFELTLMLGRFVWVRNMRVSWLSCLCVVRSPQGQSPDLVNWYYCL